MLTMQSSRVQYPDVGVVAVITSIITFCNKSNRNTHEITVITIKHNLVKQCTHQTKYSGINQLKWV